MGDFSSKNHCFDFFIDDNVYSVEVSPYKLVFCPLFLIFSLAFLSKPITMKHILLFSALLLASFASAQQTITPQDYEQMKSAGILNGHTNYIIVQPDQQVRNAASARYSGPMQTQSSVCSCLIPLDTTFSVVPFIGTNGPDYRNDDGYSSNIPIPFNFDFFGVNYDSLFINNNGNISFGAPYSTFTATPFPNASFQMIAPFWADVDTRDSVSGLVYYKITPTHMIVKWEQVGYYNMHSNLLSTFQLIITDGIDTILPAGSNVSFCYGDMQWTTGDASGGINGFGGSPSTTGVNQGNGTDYFQVTQSDTSGNAFDGPYATNDGVDFLDNQEIYFNTSLLGNVPPLVMNSTICDTIDVFTGDTLRTINQDSIMFYFYFMSPEIDQTVTATLTSNAPASAFSYVQLANTPTFKSYSCIFRAKNIPPGIYTVTGTATDNGIPVGDNTGQVVIHTYYDAALDGINDPSNSNTLNIFPNPADNQISINNIPEGTLQLVITDVLGQTVFSAPSTNKNAIIDTSNFTPGVYFITLVKGNGERETMKFIRR